MARTSDPADGRATRVTMTATGRQLVLQAEADVARGCATLTAGLSAVQRRELTRLLAVGARPRPRVHLGANPEPARPPAV